MFPFQDEGTVGPRLAELGSGGRGIFAQLLLNGKPSALSSWPVGVVNGLGTTQSSLEPTQTDAEPLILTLWFGALKSKMKTSGWDLFLSLFTCLR